jgi:hypothetical protein
VKALALIVILGLMGCGVGYRCEGPTCPADAGTDAGVDAGAVTCSPTCRGCCDPRDGRCIEPLADSNCKPPDPSAGNWCVACQAPQVCGYRDPLNIGCIQPWTCTQSCGTGCCDPRSARCLNGAANDAGACL